MFRDMGQTLDDFGDVMDVRCPRCGRHAQVARVITAENEQRSADSAREKYLRLFHPRRLSCLHCGHTKTRHEREFRQGGPDDWYFGLPLWLQTPCCGSTLWALNRAHLDFLEQYVTAQQRAKLRTPGPGLIRNRSIASRLPLWMKSAKNRKAVTRSLARLKSLLD